MNPASAAEGNRPPLRDVIPNRAPSPVRNLLVLDNADARVGRTLLSVALDLYFDFDLIGKDKTSVVPTRRPVILRKRSRARSERLPTKDPCNSLPSLN
jgi:hypothetical protein